MGFPIFFRQFRSGLNAKPFTLIKFRTMRNNKRITGEMDGGKDRLTKLGIFLRKTSLDELPSFINVFKGEMSLVGPRPLLIEYLDRYTKFQAQRHRVKPGITGWAQVNGRNALSWEEKFELDNWYIKNQSIFLDLKIFFKTIIIVFGKKGINKINDDLMEEFK
tara:strand:- start:1460 stop:1948 length:489 start_codon:yes stop_codon:yes gene_type:complete